MKSDADIIRDAKLAAEEIEPLLGNWVRHGRPEMATDEMVRVLLRFYMFVGGEAVQEVDAKVVACYPSFPTTSFHIILLPCPHEPSCSNTSYALGLRLEYSSVVRAVFTTWRRLHQNPAQHTNA